MLVVDTKQRSKAGTERGSTRGEAPRPSYPRLSDADRIAVSLLPEA